MSNWLRKESDLIGAALALGARGVRGWSPQEERLSAKSAPQNADLTSQLRKRIQNGGDPLGAAFCRIRTPETRREMGATYTPAAIVSAMLRWAQAHGAEPARVVEPGAGSARFLAAGGRRFKNAELIGVEVDPLPAMSKDLPDRVLFRTVTRGVRTSSGRPRRCGRRARRRRATEPLVPLDAVAALRAGGLRGTRRTLPRASGPGHRREPRVDRRRTSRP